MSMSLLIPVNSTSISGYTHLADQTLVIVFTSGSIYRYDDVPVSTVEEFARSSSKGKYHHKNIKHIYNFRPLEQFDLEELVRTVGVMGTAHDATPRRILEPHEIAALLERFPVIGMMF